MVDQNGINGSLPIKQRGDGADQDVASREDEIWRDVGVRFLT